MAAGIRCIDAADQDLIVLFRRGGDIASSTRDRGPGRGSGVYVYGVFDGVLYAGRSRNFP